ncbi:MAG: hypothetical protein U1F15_08935 [Burkholderiales bacterium]
MKKGKEAVLIVGALVVSGCALSSGVLPMGPDTYSVSVSAAPARGGTTGARQVALTEAGKYCADQGKQILVTNTSAAQTNNLGAGKIDVTFQCLAKGDPDLQRPTYRSTPDIVIQDQRAK